MKVLPKRKGNLELFTIQRLNSVSLNESPSKKEGKSVTCGGVFLCLLKGLNESPSKKEGKISLVSLGSLLVYASMKAPPKRRGKNRLLHHAIIKQPASMKALPRRKGNLHVLQRIRLN